MRKPIKGYEGRYEVSDDGNIWSLPRKHVHSERKLKKWKHKNGFYGVNLMKDGSSKAHRIHTIVAKHFVDNPKNKVKVLHIDRDYSNNAASNLKWANSQHEHTNGKHKRKARQYTRRPKWYRVVIKVMNWLIRDK